MDENLKNSFLFAASEWVCDKFYLDIRYFALKLDNSYVIVRAAISLNPLPPAADNSFEFKSESFLIGQTQMEGISKYDLLEIVKDACQGKIKLGSEDCLLKGDPNFSYYSEILNSDKFFYNLHLRVSGQSFGLPNQLDILQADNMLRASNPPFDGLKDILLWLGFDGTQSLGSRSSDISIWINPPVDIVFDNCLLSKDKLKIYLKAHPDFNTKQVSLAVRPLPGLTVMSRRQIADHIEWSSLDDGYNQGNVEVTLEHADSALAMLLVGNHVVRKQWFVDPEKARNNRFLAVQHFDKDLKMARKAVFESADSGKFENGIALLLYILGFTPAVQIETDSPDLIVSTMEGRVIIVECTTRTADFSVKLGKLVDRRGALIKALQDSGHHSMVHSVLVCRLPRDQIATSPKELKEANVILLTKEDLENAFERVRYGADSDILIRDAESKMISNVAD